MQNRYAWDAEHDDDDDGDDDDFSMVYDEKIMALTAGLSSHPAWHSMHSTGCVQLFAAA